MDEETKSLIEWLRAWACSDKLSSPFRRMSISADLIEAANALQAQAERVKALEESLCYLGKWIERGIFDDRIAMGDALNVMAHFPGMPWNSKRWDVDHKPYAAKYYETFPKTAPHSLMENRNG